jgi:hypothetical protein
MAKKGEKLSQEMKDRIRISVKKVMIPYKRTEEHRQQIKERMTGNHPKKESIEKMRQTLKRRYASGELIPVMPKPKKGIDNPNYKGGKPKCIDCGKLLSSYAYKRCPECFHKYATGENSCHYKGGITPENRKIRASSEYKLWHKICLERD